MRHHGLIFLVVLSLASLACGGTDGSQGPTPGPGPAKGDVIERVDDGDVHWRVQRLEGEIVIDCWSTGEDAKVTKVDGVKNPPGDKWSTRTTRCSWNSPSAETESCTVQYDGGTWHNVTSYWDRFDISRQSTLVTPDQKRIEETATLSHCGR